MSRIDQAIKAMQIGDKIRARQILAELLQSDPGNEEAWLRLSSIAESANQKRYCLRRVLEINPANDAAKRSLAQLKDKEVLNDIAHEPPLPRTEYQKFNEWFTEATWGKLGFIAGIFLVSSSLCGPDWGRLLAGLGILFATWLLYVHQRD